MKYRILKRISGNASTICGRKNGDKTMIVSERRENPRNKIEADVRVVTPEASLPAMLTEISY